MRCLEPGVGIVAGELTRLKDALTLAEQKNRNLEVRVDSAEQSARDTRRERDHQAALANDAETALAKALSHAPESDYERSLRNLIKTRWQAELGTDCRDHPLVYEFAAGFVTMAETQPQLLDRLASACAMIASRYPQGLIHRHIKPLRAENGLQLTREDAATAWCCNLTGNGDSQQCLHYWVRTDGTIWLSIVGSHDSISEQ